MRLKLVLSAALLLASVVAHAETKAPAAQIDTLMQSLKAEKPADGLFSKFFQNSLAGQLKPVEMKALDGQAKGSLEYFGPLSSYEIVESRPIGNSLMRVKVLSKHRDELPLFWNFTFYQRHGQWEPLALFFFDDPAKAGF